MAPANTQKADDSVSVAYSDNGNVVDRDPAEQGNVDLNGHPEILDKASFDQILEMDDDEDEREFSKGIVYGFFDQAETTFKKIEKEINDANLEELSSLGHFLKGSSATLGMTKVKDYCEKIQHLGSRKEETGENSTSPQEDSYYLNKIKAIPDELDQEYRSVEKLLRRFYGEKIEEPEIKPETKETEKTEEKPVVAEKKDVTTEEKSTKQAPETTKAPEDTESAEAKKAAK